VSDKDEDYVMTGISGGDFSSQEDEIKWLRSELSLVRHLLCEVRDGHVWESQEQDEIMNLPWERCKICGSGRASKPKLRLVPD